MVDKNKIEGAVQKTVGKVESVTGAIAEDPSTQAEGKVRQAEGTIQGAAGETIDTARGIAQQISDITKGQPLWMLLAAGIAGFVLGQVSGTTMSNVRKTYRRR